jgi:hypothetical protein
MENQNEFRKYAVRHHGISSLTVDRYTSVYGNYISPTIIEERQLNVASMDVFSRLMMDRIIFLGVPIDDTVANIIQAQLLFLESTDPTKEIQIYFNTRVAMFTPGWEFTTPCSLFRLMWPPFAPAWPLQWVLYCLPQEPKENDGH